MNFELLRYDGGLPRSGAGRFDTNQSHHSSVLMFEQMTVIYKCANCFRIAKIHSQPDGRIEERAAVVIRHVYGIAEIRLIYRASQIIQQKKMQLVDVKCVQFIGPVYDNPVFHRALLRDDIRNA